MSDLIHVLELRSVRGTGGGPEKTILRGTELADRSRFQITVCYVRDARDPVFGIDRRAAGFDIEYVELHERNSFDRRIWPALVTLVRERRIDIIHAHDYKTDLLALLAARRTGTIPLATAHGWTGHSARERWLYYPLDKRLLARFPHVVAVSSEIRSQLERNGLPRERSTVVLNGIDPDTWRHNPDRRREVRAALGLAQTDRVVGTTGRVEQQKRFDILLRAFAALAASDPTLQLVIVGDGSLRQNLAAQAESLGIAPRTRFLGHREDVADLHDAFDLFVQSSEYEGTPNAVLEAMAMETPLVATDAGGTRELAEDGIHGLIVPIGDVAALSSAMARAVADPLAARARAEIARSRVVRELSFVARTRRVEQIYDRLMAERRGTSRLHPECASC